MRALPLRMKQRDSGARSRSKDASEMAEQYRIRTGE